MPRLIIHHSCLIVILTNSWFMAYIITSPALNSIIIVVWSKFLLNKVAHNTTLFVCNITHSHTSLVGLCGAPAVTREREGGEGGEGSSAAASQSVSAGSVSAAGAVSAGSSGVVSQRAATSSLQSLVHQTRGHTHSPSHQHTHIISLNQQSTTTKVSPDLSCDSKEGKHCQWRQEQ